RTLSCHADLRFKGLATQQCCRLERAARWHEETAFQQWAGEGSSRFRPRGETASKLMILRSLQPSASASEKFVSAWEAVQRTQTNKYESCWLITQPSHAALAGELAANISPPEFPLADAQILQAIALHDAGWGIPDAQALVKSRSVHPHQPQSFIAAGAAQFAEAWKSSIETCQSVSPAGGYIVSR